MLFTTFLDKKFDLDKMKPRKVNLKRKIEE